MTPDDPLTIACSLDPADVPDRRREWADLRARAASVTGLGDGVRLTFPADDGRLAEQVADLAARERDCCGFLTITTTSGSHGVELEIRTADPAARPVIDELAGVPVALPPVICCAPTPTDPGSAASGSADGAAARS